MSIEEDKKKYLQSCVLVPDEDWRPFGVPAFIYSREAPSFAHPRPARSGRHPFSLKLFVFLSWETLQPLFCLFIYWLHYHISVSLWALFSLFFSLLLTSRCYVSSLISLLLLAPLSFHLSFRFFLISIPFLLPFRLLCSFPCLFFRVFFSVYTSCHFFCFISVPVF